VSTSQFHLIEPFLTSTLRSFASSIFDIVYGIPVDNLDHPQIKDGERVMRELTIAAVPGSYLVDSFPILKYVPEWVPGAQFKSMAKTFVELQSNVINLPFSEMLQNLVRLLEP